VKPTLVTFPTGATDGAATVEAIVDLPGGHGVITHSTPFHPVDPAWPDQPADTGTLNGATVADCLVGAVGPDGQTAVGADIHARRGDPDYTWVVVHALAPGQVAPAPGDSVDLEVDTDRRRGLSRAHTACHISALALNAVTAGLWRKDVARDGIGNPDFDRIALTESRMTPDVARDTYRLGKSLRKKGFNTADLLGDLDGVAQRVEQQVASWIAADAAVRVETDGPHLADMRFWCCDVPEGSFRIACGGTHVHSLGELGAVSVRYERPDDATLVAVTTVG
jgi:alanyl-tRNA synthetase